MNIFDSEDIELVSETSDQIDISEVTPSEEATEETTEQPNEIENINTSENQEDSEAVASEEDHGEEDSDDNESEETSSNNSSLYSSFASVLSEQGVLPSLDLEENKIKSPDDLVNSIKSEIENQSKSFIIDKIGEDGYKALEKGVSLAEYQSYQNATNTLDSVTEEHLQNDLELAKRIIKEDYLNQGFSEEKANKWLSRTIDAGEDVILEDSKEALGSLKEFQNRKLEDLQKQRAEEQKMRLKEQEKIDNDLKNSIYNPEEFIKGMGKVTKSLKDTVYNSMTKIVSKDENGNLENKLMRDRRTDPIGFDTKLYYIYELTNGFKDFSKIGRTIKSSATSELEKELRRTKFDGSTGPSFVTDPESYGGIGDELV